MQKTLEQERMMKALQDLKNKFHLQNERVPRYFLLGPEIFYLFRQEFGTEYNSFFGIPILCVTTFPSHRIEPV